MNVGSHTNNPSRNTFCFPSSAETFPGIVRECKSDSFLIVNPCPVTRGLYVMSMFPDIPITVDF